MSNRLIAIVEDDYTKKSQLKALLEKAGYKVSTFISSPKLISELSLANPAIIITDKDPANPKNPFWIIEGVKREPKLKSSEVFAYLKEIEVKDEIVLRKHKITSYFTKINKINYLVEGVSKHFSLQGTAKEFDPWVEFLELQQQVRSAPAPAYQPQSGQPHPAQGRPQAPPGQPPPPGYRPPQQAPAPGHPPQPRPAAAPQAGQAQRPSPAQAPPRAREPLIPSPASLAQKHAQGSAMEPAADISDFLTTIQDSVVKKMEEKNAPPVSPALDNFNKGLAFFNKEQYPQALIMFEKSRMDKMLQAKSLVMVGKIHRKMNNMNAAIATFKEAHHTADDTETKLEARYEIAETMKVQGKLQDAYNMFATVYKTDKTFKDTRNKLIELKGQIK